MKEQQRGSEKLLASLDRGCAMQKQDVSRFVDFLRSEDLELIDWHCYGQPEPEILKGSVQVAGDRVGPTIQKLLGQEGLRLRLEVFPHGIPWPEWFRVDFTAGGPAI